MSIQWKSDPAHSEITFKVRHMMISNVTGRFGKFEATAETDDESLKNPRVAFTAQIDSIDTGSADRDTHLKSGDFFDAETHPTLEFKSTNFKMDGPGEYDMEGELTMHGETKPVTLKAEFAGLAKDPWGNLKAGFTITGKFNRRDWGLSWNAALETGGVLVSEEVKLQAEIQIVKA